MSVDERSCFSYHVAAGNTTSDNSVVDVWTAVLAIGAFLVLNRWHGKMTVLYVVLGCGLIGACIQAVGLA